jgi:putative ABC transport system ATP-binding protein
MAAPDPLRRPSKVGAAGSVLPTAPKSSARSSFDARSRLEAAKRGVRDRRVAPRSREPWGDMRAASLIEARGVVKTYTKGVESVRVLHGIDLDVDAGEWVALMGPSGSGKTTLLNLLGGLDVADEGTIRVGGDEISIRSNAELAAWRARHVGFIFQLYNLLPVLTAYQNVELPLLLTPLSRRERREHVEVALSTVGLADRMDHAPSQLSGGQQQRVAIARAIVTDPSFLLADEPTGDLDAKSAREILDLLSVLHERQGKAIVMVTHDPHAAERAQRLVHLEKGYLVADEAARA